jgi:hypothetical protein
MKNVVIITSVIEAVSSLSVYSPKDRLNQLKNTIETVKRKIPNSLVFLVNAGSISQELFEDYKNLKVDHKLEAPIFSSYKSIGEILMISYLLNSKEFIEETKNNGIKKVTKISGRYFLTEDFVYDETDAIIMKTVEPKKSWSGHGICETRYYSFPFFLLDHYVNNIKQIIKEGIFIDIEHTFYKNKILPFVENSNKLNIAGYLAPSGEYIED